MEDKLSKKSDVIQIKGMILETRRLGLNNNQVSRVDVDWIKHVFDLNSTIIKCPVSTLIGSNMYSFVMRQSSWSDPNRCQN